MTVISRHDVELVAQDYSAHPTSEVQVEEVAFVLWAEVGFSSHEARAIAYRAIHGEFRRDWS